MFDYMLCKETEFTTGAPDSTRCQMSKIHIGMIWIDLIHRTWIACIQEMRAIGCVWRYGSGFRS